MNHFLQVTKQVTKLVSVSVIVSASCNLAFADTVQNQTEIMSNKLSVGDYREVANSYGNPSGSMSIEEILPDKAQTSGHLEIRLDGSSYFADNVAFPVTYRNSAYEGNNKLKEQVGYTLMRERHYNKNRMVVVDDYIFLIDEWKNKDDYELLHVLKIGAAKGTSKPAKSSSGFGGFLGSLTGGLTTLTTGLAGEDMTELKNNVLQPYLDTATAEQQRYYATWIQKPENAKKVQYLDDVYDAMQQAMKDYNDAIFNSPEYQRMLAFHKWMDNNINMEVVNNSGSTVWIGSTKEAFITNKVPAGDSVTSSCNTDMYYYYSEQKGSQGTKFNSSDNNCGGQVTIH